MVHMHVPVFAGKRLAREFRMGMFAMVPMSWTLLRNKCRHIISNMLQVWLTHAPRFSRPHVLMLLATAICCSAGAAHIPQIPPAEDWNVADMRTYLHWSKDTSYWVPWEELASTPQGSSDGTWSKFQSNLKPMQDPQLRDMVNCINSKHESGKHLTWQRMMTDMGSLRVGSAWWSTYAREQHALTLVTASTMDRLPQVYAQCQSWPGPYSVALYHSLLQPDPDHLTEDSKAILRDAVSKVFKFISDMEQQPGACRPDVLLIYEVFADRYARMLFPVNILRNLARVQARTPLVALLDVDLVVSHSLWARMQDAALTADMIEQARNNKTVFIIPALEITKGGVESAPWADVLAAASKAVLVKAMQAGVAQPFDLIRWIYGHRLTNFQLWKSTDKDYEVRYEPECEPWVLGHRWTLPWYDPRYRGYGYNKLQHLAILGGESFRFVVMHDAFCVHRNHNKTDISAAFSDAWLLREVKGDLHGHNKGMFEAQMAKLKADGTFQSTMSVWTQSCRATLPWWSVDAASMAVGAAVSTASSAAAGAASQAGTHSTLTGDEAGGVATFRTAAQVSVRQGKQKQSREQPTTGDGESGRLPREIVLA